MTDDSFFSMFWPHAFYFTDETRTPDPLNTIKSLPFDTGVVFRHYTYTDRKILAKEVARVCKKHDLFLSIAMDPDLANKVGANACHLPEGMISRLPVYRYKYPGLLFSVACHSELAIRKAEKLGADLTFLSPIFPTSSHPDQQSMGTVKASKTLRKTKLPVYALGGIKASRFNAVSHIGFSGFGAIGYFENRP